jgi:hypothetical protein
MSDNPAQAQAPKPAPAATQPYKHAHLPAMAGSAATRR